MKLIKILLILDCLMFIPIYSGCKNSLIKDERVNNLYIQELIQQKNYNPAILLLEKSYARNKETNPRLALKNSILLGECHEKNKDISKAILHYEAALKMVISQYGRSNKNTIHILNVLARLYHDTGQYIKAKSYCQQSLEICKKILPSENNSEYSKHLNMMAIIYESLGDYNKAMSLYKESLKILTDNDITCTIQQAKIINNIAGIHLRKKEYKEAENKFKKALSIDMILNGSDAIETARDFNNLGILYKSTALYAKAEANYLSAVAIYKKKHGSFHLNVAMVLNNLGNIYEKTNNYKKAESVLSQALVIAEANKHFELIWHIQDSFRDLYEAQNQPDIAIYFGKKAVNSIQTLRLNIQNMDYKLRKSFIKTKAMAYRKLANLLIAQGRFPEARYIMDLLKEEEYHEFMGGDFSRGSKKKRDYSKNNSEGLFNRVELNLENESTSIFAIDQKFEETQKLQRLRVIKQQEAHKKFSFFLEKLKSNIIQHEDSLTIVDQIGKTKKFEDLTLCATLKDLNDSIHPNNSNILKAIVLHYLVTKQNLNIILTTSVRSKGYQVPINKTDFNDTIFKFKQQLLNINDKKGYLSLSKKCTK